MRLLLRIIATLLAALIAPSAAGDLDADCKVSINCATVPAAAGAVDYVHDLVQRLPDNEVYPDGKHIVCRQYSSGPNGFCLFFRGVAKGEARTGREVKRLMDRLRRVSNEGKDRGCGGRCGVVWDKSWGKGALRLDYVTRSCVDVCGKDDDGSAFGRFRPGMPVHVHM
ncbi:hypothetical protein JDV02_007636 [Purpureocillium takamizusanense]|uniref:Killer toxin Kp4 domain-containing protein n=1 Tax=Purpureocillium takamizusanense TaxID=2060973 RepID=A0A9Q8VE92_9HYPO|nr:uncharacterized protein JDV02_007636 [Purpureocillium takamizusanense]UNI21664.1 hypothetical protein JDV02_007636 [Purpureocillium takamizusanense]